MIPPDAPRTRVWVWPGAGTFLLAWNLVVVQYANQFTLLQGYDSVQYPLLTRNRLNGHVEVGDRAHTVRTEGLHPMWRPGLVWLQDKPLHGAAESVRRPDKSVCSAFTCSDRRTSTTYHTHTHTHTQLRHPRPPVRIHQRPFRRRRLHRRRRQRIRPRPSVRRRRSIRIRAAVPLRPRRQSRRRTVTRRRRRAVFATACRRPINRRRTTSPRAAKATGPRRNDCFKRSASNTRSCTASSPTRSTSDSTKRRSRARSRSRCFTTSRRRCW